jgi:hypothetical protein
MGASDRAPTGELIVEQIRRRMSAGVRTQTGDIAAHAWSACSRLASEVTAELMVTDRRQASRCCHPFSAAFLNDDDFNGLLARRLQRLELILELIGCSGEPGPEPGEPIGRPLAVVPTVLPSVGPPELFAVPPADAGAAPCVLPGCAFADP